MQQRDFIEQLAGIVGAEYVIAHPEDLLVYEYDGSVDRSMPRAVVLPANAGEVSQTLALAYAAGVPVVGRGFRHRIERRRFGSAGGDSDCLYPDEPHFVRRCGKSYGRH